MTAGSRAALTSGVALLERAMGYTLGGLLLVAPENMSNPTPCREWDLRALLLHMNDSLLALYEAIAVGHLGLDPPGADGDPAGDHGDPTADPVASLRDRACRMIGAWAAAPPAPGEIPIADRVLSPSIVAATGAVEVAVHGWDVARACGHDRPVPPQLAEELLELCPLFVRAADRPTRFAPRVHVSPLASPSDRLLAFLGRSP
ncbi:MAG: TIGR03086 family metal-binding protein [Actinomycetes bacterium]